VRHHGPAQLSQLKELLALARRTRPDRKLDLLLLTIGANDLYFSGLVADTILEEGTERSLFQRAGLIASLDDAQRRSPGDCRAISPRCARRSSRWSRRPRARGVRVLRRSRHEGGRRALPRGRAGFDIHPAFTVDGERVRATTRFVTTKFFPRLKALALCEGGVVCGAADDA